MQLRDIIERIEKIDEHQVRFVLKHPEAPFLADLAMPFGSILSAEYAGQLIARGKGDELNSKPIGTGPFVFTRYRKDAQVRYAANPDYWKGKPAIDHLVLAITLDPNVRVQRLRRNECQIALTPKPEDVAALRQDPQLTVLEEAAMITSHAAINTRHEPFDDPRVRRAIAMGFNKPSYLKIVFGDQARPAIGPYPPMLLGYDDSIRDWPYDPERAKALLKEAGVTPDTPLNLYISTGSGPGGNPARVAQLIQSDLAAIGIRVNIRQFEWGEMVKRTKAGEHDMMLYSWIGDNGDPDNFLTHNLGCASVESGENRARWCDKGFDEAIRKARMSNDEPTGSAVQGSAADLPRADALVAAGASFDVRRATQERQRLPHEPDVGAGLFAGEAGLIAAPHAGSPGPCLPACGVIVRPDQPPRPKGSSMDGLGWVNQRGPSFVM